MEVYLLRPAVQHYQWGSRTLIPSLLGIENPGNLPFAEIWMGSHPRGMGMVKVGGEYRELGSMIAEDPEGWTGRKDGEVSFLLKVLGIANPLSIQCHPDRKQAQSGYERENREGLAPDSPKRCYRDANHKPELLCAVSRVTAMCGFRPLGEIEQLFSRLHPSLFCGVSGYRDLLQKTFELGEEQVHEFARSLMYRDDDQSYELSRKLYARFGADPGILAPLYLQVYTLSPGQAVFLGPGVLHAYVQGMGIEVMANSDNVLRGGLTDKYIDRDELASIVHFEHTSSPLTVPEAAQTGELTYPVPVDDFILRSYFRGSYSLKGEGTLRIGICVSGTAVVSRVHGEKIFCSPGSVFCIPAALDTCELVTEGLVYIASGGRVQ